MILLMRTTLDLDQDVLEAAKEMASRSKKSAGKMISALVRKALTMDLPSPAATPLFQNGFEVLPSSGRVVTQDLIARLREDSESA
jgi:hypothetical protein